MQRTRVAHVASAASLSMQMPKGMLMQMRINGNCQLRTSHPLPAVIPWTCPNAPRFHLEIYIFLLLSAVKCSRALSGYSTIAGIPRASCPFAYMWSCPTSCCPPLCSKQPTGSLPLPKMHLVVINLAFCSIEEFKYIFISYAPAFRDIFDWNKQIYYPQINSI